ncbi:MAG: CesT family type III secretion system chaperone [Desulfovibrionaceae bacterium]|nr:CesT family type III secretion system chaperone [Desulfovibrionaceae bacterium]
MFLETIVQKFGERLGMPNLTLGEKGVGALDINEVGRLYLEILPDRENLLLYLTRSLPPYAPEIPKKALSFTHYLKAHPFPVWCGKRNDELILFTRLGRAEVSPQSIENAVLFLAKSIDELTS